MHVRLTRNLGHGHHHCKREIMDSDATATNQQQQEQLTPVFFPVSVKKLAIMSVMTYGLYQVWWVFKNWQYVNVSLEKNVAPGLRAFFSIFFNYSLFKEIRTLGQKNGVTQSLHAGVLATVWTVLTLFGAFFASLSAFGLFSVVPLILVQKYINGLNIALNPNCEINSKFTRGNCICICLGVIILVGVLNRH
jgi:hypothetical protein